MLFRIDRLSSKSDVVVSEKWKCMRVRISSYGGSIVLHDMIYRVYEVNECEGPQFLFPFPSALSGAT